MVLSLQQYVKCSIYTEFVIQYFQTAKLFCLYSSINIFYSVNLVFHITFSYGIYRSSMIFYNLFEKCHM